MSDLRELQEQRELDSRGLGADRYYKGKESSDFGDTTPGKALMLSRKDSESADGERLNLVEKFAEVIRDLIQQVEDGKAGAGRPTVAHRYLRQLQPEVVAYIAVRTVHAYQSGHRGPVPDGRADGGGACAGPARHTQGIHPT